MEFISSTPLDIEKEIYSLLLLLKGTQTAPHTFFERLSNRNLSLEAQKIISHFFWTNTLYTELIEIFKDQIRLNNQIAWGHFVKTLELAQVEITEDLQTLILQGSREQLLLDELATYSKWDHLEPKLIEIRKNKQWAWVTEYQYKIQELLQKIELFRSQEMTDQEKLAINDLLFLSPHHPKVKQLQDEFKQRMAQKLLESKLTHQPSLKTNIQHLKSTPETIAHSSWLLELFQSALNEDKENAFLIKDFMIHSLMLDEPLTALSLIKDIPVSKLSYDEIWLKFISQKLSHQLYESLETLNDISLHHQSNTDIPLILSYEKALVLWELKEQEQALKLMKEVEQTDPEFRNASSLVTHWSKVHE